MVVNAQYSAFRYCVPSGASAGARASGSCRTAGISLLPNPWAWHWRPGGPSSCPRAIAELHDIVKISSAAVTASFLPSVPCRAARDEAESPQSCAPAILAASSQESSVLETQWQPFLPMHSQRSSKISRVSSGSMTNMQACGHASDRGQRPSVRLLLSSCVARAYDCRYHKIEIHCRKRRQRCAHYQPV